LRARLVCPIAGPPIDGGVVEIAAGLVVDVHDRPHAQTVDLGDVALLPGLVNCHTHLEFSNLSRPLSPPQPFATWIGAVVAERRRRCQRDESSPSIGRRERDPLGLGLTECFRTGTAAVGDIVTGLLTDADDQSLIVENIRRGRLLPFRELLAPRPGAVESTWQTANEYLRSVTSPVPEAGVGLSPHAPYTVTGDLLKQAVDRAINESRPVAMHVAETLEELEFLNHRTGPLAEMLERGGEWDPSAIQATRPMDILKVLSSTPRSLVVHGNYLTTEELKYLGEHSQLSLIYCPRTHIYFQHARYPLEEALRLGVNVGLGTDSRASNPDLNLWEEVKAVARTFPNIDAATILKLATVNGALALGQSSRHGAIEAGRPADLCCVQLDAGVTDLQRAVIGPESKVVAVMHSGEWVVRPRQVDG
jgi:cytosine/adenosine deaminase-related metal-dependent hydrolase